MNALKMFIKIDSFSLLWRLGQFQKYGWWKSSHWKSELKVQNGFKYSMVRLCKVNIDWFVGKQYHSHYLFKPLTYPHGMHSLLLASDSFIWATHGIQWYQYQGLDVGDIPTLIWISAASIKVLGYCCCVDSVWRLVIIFAGDQNVTFMPLEQLPVFLCIPN